MQLLLDSDSSEAVPVCLPPLLILLLMLLDFEYQSKCLDKTDKGGCYLVIKTITLEFEYFLNS